MKLPIYNLDTVCMEKETLGFLTGGGIPVVSTIELPWNDNDTNISCIPAGTYKVERVVSPSQGECFQILDVPKRSHILIHIANYVTDILGCVGVGEYIKDINSDGLLDVANSGTTMKMLLDTLPDEFLLEINRIGLYRGGYKDKYSEPDIELGDIKDTVSCSGCVCKQRTEDSFISLDLVLRNNSFKILKK